MWFARVTVASSSYREPAEREPFSREQMESLLALAGKGIQLLITIQRGSHCECEPAKPERLLARVAGPIPDNGLSAGRIKFRVK